MVGDDLRGKVDCCGSARTCDYVVVNDKSLFGRGLDIGTHGFKIRLESQMHVTLPAGHKTRIRQNETTRAEADENRSPPPAVGQECARLSSYIQTIRQDADDDDAVVAVARRMLPRSGDFGTAT